jgi:ligand-binding sensor domain-containing protein
VFDGALFRTFNEKDGLVDSCVWALAEDHEHNIWIGSYGGGVFQYRNGAFTQYTMEQGLASRIVFQITVAQDDSLWIATPDGLSHVQGGSICNYTTTDGLSSTRILDIHQDRAGTIWVATQGGVDRLAAAALSPCRWRRRPKKSWLAGLRKTRWANLYTTDVPRGISRIKDNQLVLQDSTLDLMDMVEAPDHNLWFSSREGIVRIAEQKLAQSGKSGTPPEYPLTVSEVASESNWFSLLGRASEGRYSARPLRTRRRGRRIGGVRCRGILRSESDR